ncbi:MAG TPA: glycosyltransferase [Thermoanaerobaculia bacterium]|nr:glycosyltransferase [Thermoanaerobaculia bacterium]
MMPATISPPKGSAAHARYIAARREHWNHVARLTDRWSGWGGAYHRRLREIYGSMVLPGQRVLELGCGLGDLLAAVEPQFGVGVDFSEEMLARAARRHSHLHFVNADVQALGALQGRFDVIVLSDVINDLWDVQATLEGLRHLMIPSTRLIFNIFSRLWQLPLELAQRLRLAKPLLPQNWLTVEDLLNLLRLTDLEPVRSWQECLLPFPVPGLAAFCNRVLVRLWPFKHLALSSFVVARCAVVSRPGEEALVSVVVPARNEEGNIAQIFRRTPDMGRGTELIFVEGHSKDRTLEVIQEEIAKHPDRRARLLRQPGIGKGDAVRQGFAAAAGEILMILDADLSVRPEDLARFYDVLRSSKGEFASGVRLVYPMEAKAMRFINLLGNKAFGIAFSWLLDQSIRDTLCGTKALSRADYDRIAENRSYFGDFDPFGDFDLLFGAARLNLRIVEVPIRYHQRTYGTTNIQRWKHGWLLLKMVLFAARRIKFC